MSNARTQAALLGLLVAVTWSPSSTVAAADAPPALELVASHTKVTPRSGVLILVIRRADAVGKPITLRAADGAHLWSASPDRACSGASQGTALLELPADAANPAPVCFAMDSVTAGVQALATIAAGNTVYSAATQSIDIAEPVSQSFWDKPGVSVILSAFVGFVFGLGSAWFQVWFDTWKQAREAGASAQQFIASALFPELRDHATALAEYVNADDAKRRAICTRTLKVPKITDALSAGRLAGLSSYFASVSHAELDAELRAYDENLTSFNRWADRLSQQQAADRETGEQQLIAGRLRDQLAGWRIA